MYLGFLKILVIILQLVFFNLSYNQAVRTDQVKSAKSSLMSTVNELVLPFPKLPAARMYGESILGSRHLQRTFPSHIPANSLNMLIILFDNLGVGRATTIGGAINSTELSKVYNEGFAFNKFHSTVICSPIHMKFK